jgi:3-dehydroquinate synthase
VSQFAIAHGEAVAIGMAVDLLYSAQARILPIDEAYRILELIERIGFAIYSEELHSHTTSGELTVLEGLEEFREHLGGELTVTLVPEIGRKLEVHEMDHDMIVAAVDALAERVGKRGTTMPMMEQTFA